MRHRRLLAATSVAALATASMVFGAAAAVVGSKLYYNFDYPGVLYEARSSSESASAWWWLSSGAKLVLQDGLGSTLQGTLPRNDYWRRYYASSNPVDTDNGYRPQNIFRLVTRSRWRNARQQVYFRIRRDNLSASPNRAAHNGLFLMQRYVDENNLYVAGIRVDGAAVVKKKLKGRYHTMAYAQVFPGTYHRDTRPSLLPKNIWLGLKLETLDYSDGSVRVLLYVDLGPGGWVPVFDILDNGLQYGPALRTSGYGGMRTDFMDVELENYWAVKLY